MQQLSTFTLKDLYDNIGFLSFSEIFLFASKDGWVLNLFYCVRVNRAVGKTLSFGFQQVLNKYLKRHLEVLNYFYIGLLQKFMEL